ncbi:ATP-dependent helicase [Bacillus carboniphilus]|uniref:DNA 3'-5' helicase n=1 Tax=Bacillus carboniphilus TaxID=86663 RepID=A0ABN0W1C5_9BACI
MNGKEAFFEKKKSDIGVSLNKVQKEAVLQTKGPLLLLASPGSGKTTTIIMRIGYLIEVKQVKPSSILAITFSRESARDMKERFSQFFPTYPSETVSFSTIHSLAFKIVREYLKRSSTSYLLIEGEDSLQNKVEIGTAIVPLNKKLILKQLYYERHSENITEDQLEELTSFISFLKNKLVAKEQWSSIECSIPNVTEIVSRYEEFKNSASNHLLLDYDDMLTVALKALNEDPELLSRYQRKFKYVLTDESQDTSLVQHLIVEKLVKEHQNICVVADDDQSIYTWRAAEPQYLLDFKKVYPQAKILLMEQNFRSSKEIVEVANQFIKRNKKRYEKEMFTTNPPFQQVKIRRFSSDKIQVKYIVQQILEEDNLGEVAILYRNNSSSIQLVNEMDLSKIPFYIKDTDHRFFSHWVVKDILNFMRMTFTDKRVDILEKIYTKFNAYITKQQMTELTNVQNQKSVFDNLLEKVELQEYQVKQIKRCKQLFREMRGAPPLEVIQIIRTKLGYEKALEKMCERLGFRKENLLGILNTLEEIAVTLDTMEEFATRLQHLEKVMKTAAINKKQSAVTLSTFHSSKGLEFNRVYLVDLVDGMIPSHDDIKMEEKGNLDKMEEAARLFYVGMTRAKRELELLTYEEKNGVRCKESLFVSDVRDIINPPNVIKQKESQKVKKDTVLKDSNGTNAIKEESLLKNGEKIRHRMFGIGEIKSIENDFIHIQFPSGIKKLSISTCIEAGVLECIEYKENHV